MPWQKYSSKKLPETGKSAYGQRAVFVGEKARRQGLVDQISTLENVIAQLGEEKVTKKR